MTTVQSMMLSICFGAVMGMFIAEVIFIIRCAIEKYKEKKRERMEKKESADKAE